MLSSAQSPSPSPSPSSGPPSSRATRASKWGRLLGSSSVDSASDTSTKVAVSRSLSARESLRETAQGRQSSGSSSNGGQGNKVFPKAPKLAPGGPATLARQDTIDEGGEADLPTRDRTHHLERQPTERDRLLDTTTIVKERALHMDRNLSLERERQIEMATSRATKSDTYDTGLREQPPTMAQRDLLATVLDLKVDVRLEMQRMQQRIGRIEDLMTELIKRLSYDSSGVSTPGDDSVQTIITTPISTAVPLLPGTIASTSTIVSTLTITPPTSSSQSSSLTLTSSVPTQSSQVPPSLSVLPGTSSGGNGLGPILLRKRRSKSRKAPAPPKHSPEQTRLLEAELPSTSSTTRKRDFL